MQLPLPWLDSAASFELPSYVSTGLQTACTVLVAVLLCLLTRTIERRYLRYWAIGWVALAIGLISLNLSFWTTSVSWPFLSVYWIGGDAFGFLVYIGCRDYAQDRPLEARDGWLLVPPALLGLVLPAQLVDINSLFPAHAVFFGGYCLLAFAATLRARPEETQTRIGLRLLQFGLVCVVILFWHYSVILGAQVFQHKLPGDAPWYMNYSALFDAFFELMLAFAQVLLATDSVRRDLAAANRQLQAISDQLALAARTDALTGLLNRRALDSLLADPGAAPAPGAIAVIDVNDLKPINDRHGHTTGDAVLRTVARALQSRSRIGDPVFRIGGDEFLLLLPGVPAADLLRRLEDVDQSLVSARLPGVAHPIHLSVSWGVSEYRDRGDLIASIDRADAAMYAQKQGRKTSPRRHVS